MFIKSGSLATVLLVGSTLILGGCGAETPETSEAEPGVDESMVLGTTKQAVYSGWTAYTSDGRAAIVCDGSSLPTRAQCEGRYCDNVRLDCQPTAGVRGASEWTGYFSDEGYPTAMICPPGRWMTGFTCLGDYCDRVSIQCTEMSNISRKNCFWSGWHSDEAGALTFGPNLYPAGASCRGDYCDDLKYYLCSP
ncbi:hypothetical protein G4177_24835 [Corallococcus sp. ZKHCc1 1396]|uniref:Lipoprotein n=1 Tax=Corallococcus soli TaxID=2710757 RepID=A0ABR9PU76_9BACT|nr:hypothetical protein [Corallococcus soli]MBE4751404.1 hypothetical protein [Corallococcus soli]